MSHTLGLKAFPSASSSPAQEDDLFWMIKGGNANRHDTLFGYHGWLDDQCDNAWMNVTRLFHQLSYGVSDRVAHTSILLPRSPFSGLYPQLQRLLCYAHSLLRSRRPQPDDRVLPEHISEKVTIAPSLASIFVLCKKSARPIQMSRKHRHIS